VLPDHRCNAISLRAICLSKSAGRDFLSAALVLPFQQLRSPGAGTAADRIRRLRRIAGRDLAADSGEHPQDAAGDTLSFPILSARTASFADKCRKSAGCPAGLQGFYRNFGTDFGSFTRGQLGALPMPSLTLISTNGELVLCQDHPNYTPPRRSRVDVARAGEAERPRPRSGVQTGRVAAGLRLIKPSLTARLRSLSDLS